jgi:RNA polymerase sigma factor (sigma-70 family)
VQPADPTSREPAALSALVREEWPRVLAIVARTAGSLTLAEDAVQDAVVRALEVWPRLGVPPQPRAWLLVTARRRAIDLLRRESARPSKEAEAVGTFGWGVSDEPAPPEDEVRDDLLRLLFTCCHPSLEIHSRVALALRLLCGLSTAEVARALLLPEATLAKRLTRAKQKIAAARIPYLVPAGDELPRRLTAVLATAYLLFNEGYAPTAGDRPVRPELCDEAVRLGRLLRELLPDDPSVIGLLALMLLQDGRRAARTGQQGDAVLLPDQDRALWDRARMAEGIELVTEGLRRTPDRPDRYVVQAAIAACHALATSWADTDWDAIVGWYDVLLTTYDTPVVRLNRAAAVAECRGPEAGLAALDAVGPLDGYPLLPATRGELLARAGRPVEAAVAFRAALALPLNAGQRAHLERRLREVT